MEAMDNNVTKIGDMAKRTVDHVVAKAEAIKDVPQEYNVVTYIYGKRLKVGTVWLNFGTDRLPSIEIETEQLKELTGKVRAWFYPKMKTVKRHA